MDNRKLAEELVGKEKGKIAKRGKYIHANSNLSEEEFKDRLKRFKADKLFACPCEHCNKFIAGCVLIHSPGDIIPTLKVGTGLIETIMYTPGVLKEGGLI